MVSDPERLPVFADPFRSMSKKMVAYEPTRREWAAITEVVELIPNTWLLVDAGEVGLPADLDRITRWCVISPRYQTRIDHDCKIPPTGQPEHMECE